MKTKETSGIDVLFIDLNGQIAYFQPSSCGKQITIELLKFLLGRYYTKIGQ